MTERKTLVDAQREGPKEGQMVELTGRDGQKDTVLDLDRTNDKPLENTREAKASFQDKLKELADKMRGVEKDAPPTPREKIQKVVDQVAEKTRSRGMERGR